MTAWRYEISLLVLKKYFTRSLRSLVKYFQHSKRNFLSPRGHVIFSICADVINFCVEYINADDVIAFCLYLMNKVRRNLIMIRSCAV